jgi:methylphosphotriester-DNA--protein-cysteine methyltransferase
MRASSFHQHFKTITSTTPLQYQKLSDLSHAESAWRDTPERSMIDYAMAASLSI